MMNRAAKRILKTVLALILLGVLWFGVMVYHGMYLFGVEDRVVMCYTPVVAAINQYEKTNGVLPSRLDDLVPDYLDAIPLPPYADSVSYRTLPEPNAWELSVVSTKWWSSYTYLRRFDGGLTDDQKPRMFRGIHDGWYAWRN